VCCLDDASAENYEMELVFCVFASVDTDEAGDEHGGTKNVWERRAVAMKRIFVFSRTRSRPCACVVPAKTQDP
jgi:hypothetical protein